MRQNLYRLLATFVSSRKRIFQSQMIRCMQTLMLHHWPKKYFSSTVRPRYDSGQPSIKIKHYAQVHCIEGVTVIINTFPHYISYSHAQKGELTLKEYTQWFMDHTDLSMQLMNILFEVSVWKALVVAMGTGCEVDIIVCTC